MRSPTSCAASSASGNPGYRAEARRRCRSSRCFAPGSGRTGAGGAERGRNLAASGHFGTAVGKFINIPIRFDGPTDADFEAFAAALKGLGERKVLVHCQVNLRASSMVFLYRAIVLKEDPKPAYDAVERKHQIDFELL